MLRYKSKVLLLAAMAFAATLSLASQNARASETEINALIQATRTTFLVESPPFGPQDQCALDEEFCFARAEFLTVLLDNYNYNVLGWVQANYSPETEKWDWHVAPVVMDHDGKIYVVDTVKSVQKAVRVVSSRSLVNWAKRFGPVKTRGWAFFRSDKEGSRPASDLPEFALRTASAVYHSIKDRGKRGRHLWKGFRRSIAKNILVIAVLKTVVETAREQGKKIVWNDSFSEWVDMLRGAVSGLTPARVAGHLRKPRLDFNLGIGIGTMVIAAWPEVVSEAIEMVYHHGLTCGG